MGYIGATIFEKYSWQNAPRSLSQGFRANFLVQFRLLFSLSGYISFILQVSTLSFLLITHKFISPARTLCRPSETQPILQNLYSVSPCQSQLSLRISARTQVWQTQVSPSSPNLFSHFSLHMATWAESTFHGHPCS